MNCFLSAAFVSITSVSAPAAAQTTIVLRSGNGMVGDDDAEVSMLVGPVNSHFPDPFDASDFAAAKSAPPALIVSAIGSWVQGLSNDPDAKWVSNSPDLNGQATGLYAISFDLPNGKVRYAALSISYSTDNHLSDSKKGNGSGPGVNPEGLYLNGKALPGADPGNFDQESAFFCGDVSSALVPGENTLYFYSYDWGAYAGLIFSAELTYELEDALGTTFCDPAEPNSTTYPATITAYGELDVAQNDLTLVARDVPPGEFGYFLVGMGTGMVDNPGGSEGRLCLAGADIGRLNAQVKMSDACGTISIPVDLTNLPLNPPHVVLPGETWNFQGWFRDGMTSNFTDSVAITFQ